MALAESASRFELAPIRENFSHIPEVLPLPNLIQTQTESFNWFVQTRPPRAPGRDHPDHRLHRQEPRAALPRLLLRRAKVRRERVPHSRSHLLKPLKVEVDLIVKETGGVKHQTVFMGDFPWMTQQGTFIINGAERVVVSQLVRSPGVSTPGRRIRPPGRSCSPRR